jgi:hypothetical protein
MTTLLSSEVTRSARAAYCIGGTELRHPPASWDDRRHCLLIGLPYSYAESPYRRYPVLFLCDGYWDFTLLLGLYGGLLWDKAIEEFMIVGLAYGSGYPDDPGIKQRSLDYGLTDEETLDGPPTTRAAQYLAYLTEVVVPFVEREYRVKADGRTIAGCSNAGAFSLYAALRAPQVFSHALAVSPGLSAGDGVVGRLEQRHAERVWPSPLVRPFTVRGPSPANMFLAVGDQDSPRLLALARRFHRQIARRRYAGFRCHLEVVPGQSHAGAKGAGYARGLRFAFPVSTPAPVQR